MLEQKQENWFFFSFFKSNLQVHLWKGVIHLNVFNIEKEEDLLLVTIQYNPGSLASMETHMIADIKIIIDVDTAPFQMEHVG